MKAILHQQSNARLLSRNLIGSSKRIKASQLTTQGAHIGRMSLGFQSVNVGSCSTPLIGSNFRTSNFSTKTSTSESTEVVDKKGSGSIFDEADFGEETSTASHEIFGQNQPMMWLDSNDTTFAFQGALLKDSANIPNGTSTYGIWEYVQYMDHMIFDQWMYMAQSTGLGMCGGLLLTAAATRLIFVPVGVYSQITSYKLKLLQPDMDEMQANMKRYNQQADKDAVKIERSKIKLIRRNHGIYPMINLFNLFQLPVHFVYISLINKLSYNFVICPAMLTDGFLWFKDLTSPDPTGLLPLLGGMFSLLNILSSNASSANPTMRKFSKLIRIFPIISVPIWMTFPVAFNLYWLVTSGTQLCLVNMMRSASIRKYFGLDDFLDGSKLQRLNTRQREVTPIMKKQKVYTDASKKVVLNAAVRVLK